MSITCGRWTIKARRFTALFDLDGTISDPKEGITKSLAYAMERMGRACPAPDTLGWCIGPPLQESLVKLLGDEPEDCARCLALFRERFSTVGLFENTLYPGIGEALGNLTSSGVQLVLATSKPTVFAERILAHFGLAEQFSAVYGAELDGTRTNKVELLAFLLERESLEPSEAVMIGDREHDIIAARRNGLRNLGVLYGYGSREELDLAGADAVCEAPGEIPGCVVTIRELST